MLVELVAADGSTGPLKSTIPRGKLCNYSMEHFGGEESCFLNLANGVSSRILNLGWKLGEVVKGVVMRA